MTGIISGVAAGVASGRAAGDPPPDSGVDVLPYGYRPHVSAPGKNRSHSPATPAPGADDPVRSSGNSNGCPVIVPSVACGAVTLGNAPTATPANLAQRAWKDVRLPLPAVATAPPRGSDGLVGLAEWFWVTNWSTHSDRVQAGGVWAEVTARPTSMTIMPGFGQPPLVCNGPGTRYDRRRPATAQRSACSFIYQRSSAGMPGSAYRVTVTVTWGGTWRGSGGVGGTLPVLTRSTNFSLRVAEGQAVTGS